MVVGYGGGMNINTHAGIPLPLHSWPALRPPLPPMGSRLLGSSLLRLGFCTCSVELGPLGFSTCAWSPVALWVPLLPPPTPPDPRPAGSMFSTRNIPDGSRLLSQNISKRGLIIVIFCCCYRANLNRLTVISLE